MFLYLYCRNEPASPFGCLGSASAKCVVPALSNIREWLISNVIHSWMDSEGNCTWKTSGPWYGRHREVMQSVMTLCNCSDKLQTCWSLNEQCGHSSVWVQLFKLQRTASPRTPSQSVNKYLSETRQSFLLTNIWNSSSSILRGKNNKNWYLVVAVTTWMN